MRPPSPAVRVPRRPICRMPRYPGSPVYPGHRPVAEPLPVTGGTLPRFVGPLLARSSPQKTTILGGSLSRPVFLGGLESPIYGLTRSQDDNLARTPRGGEIGTRDYDGARG